LFELHATVAPVAAPVPSTNPIGALLLAPTALFQFPCATTPTTSPAPIGTSCPTKSIPITPGDPTVVVIVRFTVAVCATAPLVPVIVNVELPAVTPTVVTVSVELPVPVTDPALNVPFDPAGSPLTLKFTAPLNPFNAPTFTV